MSFIIELILLFSLFIANNKIKITIISAILSICLFCYFEFSDNLESFVLNKFNFNHKKVNIFFDESSELAVVLSLFFVIVTIAAIIILIFQKYL